MKKVAIIFTLLFLIFGGYSQGIGNAAVIAFFDNSAYTDPAQESAQLITSLTNLGHTVNVFSGITASAWTTATAGADLLVIPELDNASLFPDLDGAAQAAIANYVISGGGLLMFDRTAHTLPMLNGIFGYGLFNAGPGVTNLNVTDATGTPFAGGPAALSAPSSTDGVLTTSLPAGALDLYNNGTGATSVFALQEGQGHIVYLGFDWTTLPTPSEWEEVLGSAVIFAQTKQNVQVPTMTEYGMIAFIVLAGLGAICYLKSRKIAEN